MAIIKIQSHRYTSDWFTYDSHKVESDDIFGFELHYRGEWHVVVKTKKKIGENQYETYELSHGVSNSEIVRLINNPDAKILEFKNYHISSDFIKKLTFIIDWAKKETLKEISTS